MSAPSPDQTAAEDTANDLPQQSEGAEHIDAEDHWLSISDLMSGLMMIFLFIAISYMIHVNVQRERIREIAVTYSRLQTDLAADLNTEFHDDLEAWDAVIDAKTLAVRFRAPEVLFEKGSDRIKDGFEAILADFFPRYIKILARTQYSGDIVEVRIEGHTSSEWSRTVRGDEAYFNNMQLSQDRTRSVLQYVMGLEAMAPHKQWLQGHLTANGLSSSKLVLNEDGSENEQASRRVEFRVRTNAERRIVKIIDEAEK
jgi:outer membrane protein OmpA-like peptidoglycan-associated protein